MKVYSENYFRKSFVGSSFKDAYLKACKWVSTNVISKDELARNTMVHYKKETESQLPTITVTLFAITNEAEIRQKQCEVCKETHSLFYLNKNYDCNKCNANAYQRREDDMIKRKKEFCIERLNFQEEEK